MAESERKTFRLAKQHIEVIEDMDDRDIANHQTEAVRMLINAGLPEYGYKNGKYRETRLKNGLENISWLLMLGGIVGLAFTMWYPISARVPSFSVLVTGFLLWRVALVVEDHEPNVSKQLKRLLRRDAA